MPAARTLPADGAAAGLFAYAALAFLATAAGGPDRRRKPGRWPAFTVGGPAIAATAVVTHSGS